jgi:hypothetical protein
MIKGFQQIQPHQPTPQQDDEPTPRRTTDDATNIRRRTVTIFFAIIAILGWIYFFLFSDTFIVNGIEISGIQRLRRGEVEKVVYTILDQQRIWPIRSRNIFSIPRSDLENLLKDQLYAEKVAVDKKYPNILRLKVQERQSSVIVIINGTSFEVDHRGDVTRILSEGEARSLQASSNSPNRGPSQIPVLSILNATTTPTGGDVFVTENQMQRWLNLFEGLQKRGFGYRGASIESPESTKVVLDLFEPYRAYFDLLTPLNAQVDSYYAFIKEKKSDMVIYDYIDARIPGRIYYK